MGLSSMEAAEKVSPLTVLVRGAIERWLAPPILAEIASDCAISNYERKITLQALTAIMLDAVLGMQPTVHAAAIARRDEWSGSIQALYGKFGRIDPQFAAGLVKRTADGILPLLTSPRMAGKPGNTSIKVVDGTMPDGSEHRLGVLRELAAAGLPAQAVVIYDLRTGVCDRVAVDEDAYASEKVLAEALLQEAVAGEIYVADRGFCTCRLMGQLIERDAFFVFREHAYDLVYEEQSPEQISGRCSTGVVLEGKVRLCDRIRKCVWELRRIHVQLDIPTQSGEKDLWLLTNLPPECWLSRSPNCITGAGKWNGIFISSSANCTDKCRAWASRGLRSLRCACRWPPEICWLLLSTFSRRSQSGKPRSNDLRFRATISL